MFIVTEYAALRQVLLYLFAYMALLNPKFFVKN